jgi:hypothetical protein
MDIVGEAKLNLLRATLGVGRDASQRKALYTMVLNEPAVLSSARSWARQFGRGCA